MLTGNILRPLLYVGDHLAEVNDFRWTRYFLVFCRAVPQPWQLIASLSPQRTKFSMREFHMWFVE